MGVEVKEGDEEDEKVAAALIEIREEAVELEVEVRNADPLGEGVELGGGPREAVPVPPTPPTPAAPVVPLGVVVKREV